MNGKVFFDTNVPIYAIALGDPRMDWAQQLLAQGGMVSVQVLNEFAAVARKKTNMPWSEVRLALESVKVLCPNPLPITIDSHKEALAIAEKYGFRIYDALIVASALEAGCTILYSEDMQDGQVIDSKLTIRNPFR
jgi:predicted nucleic acid-binding protein